MSASKEWETIYEKMKSGDLIYIGGEDFVTYWG